MDSKYDGVKFYSRDDWSINENLKMAAAILDSFDKNKEYTNINEIIELYNIQELVNCDECIREFGEEKTNNYKHICDLFNKALGRFFGKINDESFKQITKSVSIKYIEDYWSLFVKFKVFKRISSKVFAEYLNDPSATLWVLLHQKDLVKHYDEEFAEVMRTSSQTPRLIIEKFLEKHEPTCSYYFPEKLLSEEYEEILQNYINLPTVNMNHLQLIANAQSSKECPISDKLRLYAKKKFQLYLENPSFCGVKIGYGMSVKFADVPEVVNTEKLENNEYQITYGTKWFMENLDYPTILNNFGYVFEQFDRCWRSNLVSVASKLDIFEKTLFTRGKKDYIKGNSFDFMDMLSMAQVKGYYDILKSKNIRLEDVMQWFFEEYLLQEFGVKGFLFNPPSEGSTLVEKCRTIASEMDGVLKQFRMYVQEGEIDRELFEMSSEHIVFSNLSGFVSEKYAYGNSSDIEICQDLLFSDQTLLDYIEKFKNKYSCLYDLLMNEDVKFADFRKFQQSNVKWLMEHDVVKENSDGFLEMNIAKAFILKDLYDHDVICLQYYDSDFESIIDEWKKEGDLRLADSLFSEPEQNYLNYQLNKASYSNGLDLRNKYAHSTYSEDETTQSLDYIKLLRIMILIITKINEEFCLRELIEK